MTEVRIINVRKRGKYEVRMINVRKKTGVNNKTSERNEVRITRVRKKAP